MLRSDSLILNAKVDTGGSFSAGVHRFPEMFRAAGVSLDAKFEVTPGGKKEKSLERALLGLDDGAGGEDNTLSVGWEDGLSLEAALHPKRTAGKLNLIVTLPVGKDRDFVQRSDQAGRLASFLASAFPVAEMFAVRSGGSKLRICPHPPLAITPWQMVFVSERSVAGSYDDPRAFWNAGWERREDFASGSLLVRGEFVDDDVAYLERVVPMQWKLARAAKAGLTKYFRPVYEDEVEAIYRQGESVLHPSGYVEGQRLAEFTCYVGADEHIPGWEIYGLWGIRKEGKLSDGRAVDTVRVVFADRDMALRERRPLLDIGARVFYDYTSITEITE